MTLTELKTRLPISLVLQHYNLVPDKNEMLHCPFHADKSPSMKIYYETDTAYCFAGSCLTHGKSMDVIDFIMYMEKSNKAEAIRKAKSLAGAVIEKPTPTNPKMDPKARIALLTKLYEASLENHTAASRAYAESRKIALNMGYCAQKLPGGWHEPELAQLESLGVLKPDGKLHFANCLLFALRNANNEITGLYGRRIRGAGHVYLPGAREGMYPGYPSQDIQRLVLTESVIDAASLAPYLGDAGSPTAVLSLHGTGLMKEHRAVLDYLPQTLSVFFFLDGDEAGRKAAAKHSTYLHDLYPYMMIRKVKTPEGEDVNSLLVSAEGDGSLLRDWLKQNEIMDREVEREEEIEIEEELLSSIKEKKGQARASGAPALELSPLLDTTNPNKLIFEGEAAIYQVLGGLSRSLDNMKVTLSILPLDECSRRSRQKFDLYEDSQVEKAAKRAGDKLGLRADLIEMDLNELTDELEQYREKQLAAGESEQSAVAVLSPDQRKAATDFLSAPKLLKRIKEELGEAGVVGEEKNRLFIFVCASSYKQGYPLHVLVQGSSGMGKTHTQETIAKCLPKEDVIEITRVTDYSFYNYNKHDLAHKAIFFEDIDALSSEALLAVRELISKRKLSLSRSFKQEDGNIASGQKVVYGPIATVAATTQGSLYEDNAGRSFIVAIDESIEQTRRIIAHQNEISAGEIDREDQELAQRSLQNCLRLLKPMEVVNPYARMINLPEEAHKLRRLNSFFNGLVEQITWLHQYQRNRDHKGRLISEKEDLRAGIELFMDALVWKVDELDGPLRQFYEKLKSYVQVLGGANFEDYRFGRKEVRDQLRISKSQQHRFFSDLEELEYISRVNGSAYRGYRYKILVWDDAEGLRARLRKGLLDQLGDL